MFLLVPAIELYVLIEVGGIIGAVPTILLTIATAVIGANLMRSQGLATMQSAQVNMAAGQVPANEMMEGVFIFMGGLLLLIPGFVTDFIGLLFLIPPIRHALARKVISQRRAQYARYHGNVYEADWSENAGDGSVNRVHIEYHTSGQRRPEEPDVIDGEVIDSDEPKSK